jgi:hypothetical protein
MRKRLKVFQSFVDSLFPSEIELLNSNHQFKDPEIISLISDLRRKEKNKEPSEFNTSLDPRKYSKVISKSKSLLDKFDVDKYFDWINRMHSCIITDHISPEDERLILKEIEGFSISGFHSLSFYDMIQSYENHLLMRDRKKDLKDVEVFLENYSEPIEIEKKRADRLKQITKMISNNSIGLQMSDLDWLRKLLKDDQASQKNRYYAWLAFNMHFINNKAGNELLKPLTYVESLIESGKFYSRRILSNFYANKLLIFRYLNRWEEACEAGGLSLKYETIDHLYYINNYCSTLIHLDQHERAAELLRSNEMHFNNTRNIAQKVIYLAHLIRCELQTQVRPSTVRMCRELTENLRIKVFEYQWHYFFRFYLLFLYKSEQSGAVIRLNKRLQLESRETAEKYLPYIASIVQTTLFLTLGISQELYNRRRDEWEQKSEDLNFRNHLLEIGVASF